MGILRYAPRFEVVPRTETSDGHALVIVVDQPLVWADELRWFEVPLGFCCDGASVPNMLYGALEATALDLLLPGIGHDYLSRSEATVLDVATRSVRRVTRRESDEVLVAICEHLGVLERDRRLIYSAVRLAGWRHWQKKPVDWWPRRDS